MEQIKIKTGKSWKMLESGKFNTYTSRRGHGSRGKFFIAPFLKTEQFDLSLNSLKPGWINPYLHKHREQIECYVFFNGKGEMKLDDDVVEVKEGDVIVVEPQGLRAIRNTGDEELRFICIRVDKNSKVEAPDKDGIPVMEEGWFPEVKKD